MIRHRRSGALTHGTTRVRIRVGSDAHDSFLTRFRPPSKWDQYAGSLPFPSLHLTSSHKNQTGQTTTADNKTKQRNLSVLISS